MAFSLFYVLNGVLQEGSTMLTKAFPSGSSSNRLRRAALVLALLVLAAIVTGVAASATTTVVPKQLTGKWRRNSWQMHIYSSGTGGIGSGLNFGDVEFSHVTAHRLTFGGGPVSATCSGNGTYRWKVAGQRLKLKKINDACRPRVNVLAGTWLRYHG